MHRTKEGMDFLFKQYQDTVQLNLLRYINAGFKIFLCLYSYKNNTLKILHGSPKNS